MITSEVEFESIAPTYVVTDLERSIAYYCDVLGFEVLFINGEPPAYAVLKRDEAHLHMFMLQEGRHQAGHSHCYVTISGVDTLYAEYRSKGVKLVEELEKRPYGMKDFVIADLDGNHLGFGEEFTEAT